jgi:hypothetical protein
LESQFLVEMAKAGTGGGAVTPTAISMQITGLPIHSLVHSLIAPKPPSLANKSAYEPVLPSAYFEFSKGSIREGQLILDFQHKRRRDGTLDYFMMIEHRSAAIAAGTLPIDGEVRI